MGGFNYNLLNPSNYSELYIDSLHTIGYFLLINMPTRQSDNPCSLIDNIWMNNVKFRTQGAILKILVSDQFAVMLQCTFLPSKQFTQEPNSHSRLLNQNTFKLFNERLLAADWFEILALPDPNQAFSKFMQKISDVFDVCIPVVKSSNFNAKLTP